MRAISVAVIFAALMGPAAAARADDTVRITSPSAGAAVGGTVTITASAAGAASSVAFARSLDGGRTWTAISTDTDGTDGWRAVWTSAPLDGPALLRAASADASDTVEVTLRNAPSSSVRRAVTRFSPNGDGRVDTARISVRANEPANVSLVAKDARGRVRRRWTTDLAQAGTQAVSWNGRTGTGARVADGTYVIQAWVTDRAGNASTAATSVTVDTIAPRVVWSSTGPDPSTGSSTQRLRFKVVDADTSFRSTMIVRNATRAIGRRVWLQTGRSAAASWRPRARLFPGNYRTSLRMVDRAGNVGRYATRAWRVERAMPGRVFERLNGVGRRVALTFDDCYDATSWKAILDVLRAHRAQATFFCPGETLRMHPSLARRTVLAGHTVGGHGWDHSSLAGRSDSFVRSRLAADRSAWWRYGGATAAPYFRPPYGAYDSRVVRIAGELSMPRVMMWDVDPRDWTRPGASALRSRIFAQARPGSVVLLHTIRQTASALPSIIRGLRDRSLQPVSLDALFAS